MWFNLNADEFIRRIIKYKEETDMDYRSSNTDAGADRTWKNDILFVSVF